VSSAPTLSLCVLTRNSSKRLAELIDESRAFADEVVIGVDTSSSDDTFDIAARHADVVFRFEHTGGPGPARMIPLEFASGDWILSLDDDERMDSAFRELRTAFLADGRYSHYWFPRKWLVATEPPTYLRALPWFPDWQPRLFRNDRRLVWCPPTFHESYAVVGTGCHEDGTAIVHYERVITAESARRLKVASRRDSRGKGAYEDFYGPVDGVTTASLENPPVPTGSASPGRGANIVDGIQPARSEPFPPWRAEIRARVVETVPAGGRFVAEVDATNRGPLRWIPPVEGWPRLYLSYHLRNPRDEVLQWDGERTPVGRIVDTGESLRFLAVLTAPRKPGDYVLEWDLVSEGECWFAKCGSPTARSAIRVVSGRR
jgi:hypothetical protein